MSVCLVPAFPMYQQRLLQKCLQMQHMYGTTLYAHVLLLSRLAQLCMREMSWRPHMKL